MKKDKIITLRLNEIEQEWLEYCLKGSSAYTYCTSAFIKHLIYNEYYKLIEKNSKRV